MDFSKFEKVEKGPTELYEKVGKFERSGERSLKVNHRLSKAAYNLMFDLEGCQTLEREDLFPYSNELPFKVEILEQRDEVVYSFRIDWDVKELVDFVFDDWYFRDLNEASNWSYGWMIEGISELLDIYGTW